ncbi:MAG: 3-hydroxyacyl-CoA dehydrogenase, partial [Chromatiales bacterium]|nr:3-hydroxyacyl-CoA dehydrogenase [Chromatiales bacterium]
LAQLTKKMSDEMRSDFLVAHFFNPPRYMRLLELVTSGDTRPEAVQRIRDFADRVLGKGVVDCHDRPGFIANRVGTHWMQNAMGGAMELGLSVEEADAIVAEPMGIPRTGAFGLMDLVGLDLMPHILASLRDNLSPDDPVCTGASMPIFLDKMLADGYTGRKGKGGFYRMRREGGKRLKDGIDLTTGEYRLSPKVRPPCVAAAKHGGVRALVEHPSDGGRYAWRVLGPTLRYAAQLVPEIAASVAAVDEGMRLGYSWRWGPFELIDKLGVDWFVEQLEAQGDAVPPLLDMARGRSFYREDQGRLECLSPDGEYAPVARSAGVLRLDDVKRLGPRVDGNGSASLWDLGDGVLCLEFHTKMNSIDPGIMAMIGRAISLVTKRYKALVIHNDAENFSVGANVGLLLFAANMAAYEQIDAMVAQGQQVYKALKYAPFPVVGAPHGMALGGGCEILMHCDAVQAHAETYLGLVEVGVGIVPGWGGCKELLTRWMQLEARPSGPMPAIAKAFEFISTAVVGKSAAQARDMLYLRETDAITMNRDRLLADAKQRALSMVEGYEPPEPVTLNLPGPSAREAMALAVEGFLKLGHISQHDAQVADLLGRVLSGGDTDMLDEVSEQQLYDLERQALVDLARTGPTLARVEHMLETGKPLRN